jgi:hypothetical protein
VHYQLELSHKPVDPFLFKGPGEKLAALRTEPSPPAPRGTLKTAFERAGGPGADDTP